MITFSNVFKTFKVGSVETEVLKGISFSIKDGDIACFLGKSGSGKTTILNILGLIDTPSKGEYLLDGVNLQGESDKNLTTFRRKNISFIFQNFQLIPVLSVFENVEYPLILMDLSKEERAEKVYQALKSVGLEEKAKNKPNELSGGQKQRVSIARGVVKNPKIILADEPTANLDTATGMQIIELLLKMKELYKTTVIFSSHDEKVARASNNLLSINDGHLC